MITLFVALYSLLCLCTTGNTSDIKEFQVKTVKRGQAVTMECNVKSRSNLAWYRQSFGKVPQVFARQYGGPPGYLFFEGFIDNRFSVTVKDQKFDLNINETREDDGGEYFCGYVDGSTVKFTSGTRLQFEGEEMKPCPTPGTLNKNTHSVTHQGSNSRDGEGKEMKPCSTPGTHDITPPDTGSSSTDQMRVLFWLSVSRVGVLVFIIFPTMLIVYKLKYKFS
ncbi:uncharacterized protein LOC128514851 [Clarias gariepinus]|uniref:uncharacterized protein LOC128514851 n=1 Tax=Clarias gariepinus TaxID=13013 RepID=UPI00234CB574|nr:uncharacterized protein LOC128514851 [Clarias gariepinus]